MNKLSVAYILSPDKKEVYLVNKEKPNIPHIHKKLLGFGGHREKTDITALDCILRELREELTLAGLKESINPNQITERGYIIDPLMGRVEIFLINLDYKLKEMYIENEGNAKYFPLNYFEIAPDKILQGDELMLEKLFYSNEYIEIDFTDLRKTL